jgi:predicted  nucleic acid-binding Zn-ribbon protein
MNAQIISLDRRFDPTSAEAEARYDRVARRINQLRAARNRDQREADELARQFVENDLVAQTGSRRGKALTASGRRRRMRVLIDLEREIALLDEELAGLNRSLTLMNEALDQWAKEIYGV